MKTDPVPLQTRISSELGWWMIIKNPACTFIIYLHSIVISIFHFYTCGRVGKGNNFFQIKSHSLLQASQYKQALDCVIRCTTNQIPLVLAVLLSSGSRIGSGGPSRNSSLIYRHREFFDFKKFSHVGCRGAWAPRAPPWIC